MKFLISLMLCISFLALGANAKQNLRSKLLRYLPPELESIQVGTTSKAELLKKLGKPPKQEDGNNLFYNLSGRKYDTTIGIKNGRVTYVFYKPPFGKLVLKDIKVLIPKDILLEAYKQQYKSDESHSSGRTFTILLDNQNIKLTMRNNKSKSIESIYIWSAKN